MASAGEIIDRRSAPRSGRRRLLGLSLAALVLVSPWFVNRAVTASRQRHLRQEGARKAHEAAELARDALALQTDAVAMMVGNAVTHPRLLAALRGHVDRTTLADLLATETWWEPYRDRLAAISYDGATVAFSQAEGADGLPIGGLIRQVSADRKPAAMPLAGTRGVFLAAARPMPLGPHSTAVLLLANRIDAGLLATVTGRSGRPLLITDGRRVLARWGPGSPGLDGLAGQEAAGDVVFGAAAVHAAAAPIATGLWLWSVGHPGEFEQAAGTDEPPPWTAWAIAVPLALMVVAVSFRRRAPAASAPAPSLLPPQQHITRVGSSTSSPEIATRPALTPLPPGPGTALGRYLLVDRIGEGGMAEIYSAVSFGYGGFKRSFVIKRLRPELTANATAIDLFIDEANLASTLVHPNVVPVFDFGEVGGSYFLAQEYVIGRDLGRLTRRLRERGEPLLSVSAILHVAHETLAGLQYAHAKRDDAGNPLGIVHRDITPENIIISERGEVKVLDFGVMKAKQRVSQTESGTVKGSVGFMSPEQARGQTVDHRSDLYSTGLVILYAATGEPTYAGETFYDLLNAAAAGPTGALLTRIAALPAPLPTLLGRALQVDPDRRFQSSAEFRAAIAPHLPGTGATELSERVLQLFSDELHAEQERLAAAFARAPGVTPTSRPALPPADEGGGKSS